MNMPTTPGDILAAYPSIDIAYDPMPEPKTPEPVLRSYIVRWEMEIDAETPEKAAIEAFHVHRDPESIATEFDVIDIETKEKVYVDLTEDIYGNIVAANSYFVKK